MINLLDFYPEHLKNKTMIEIIKAEQLQIEKEEESIELLINEFFVDTAVRSIPIWCKFVGIEDDTDLDLDTRRSNVKAALKTQEVTTVQVIKNIAESYSNGTCEVIEDYSNYSFKIKFISTIGIPKRIGEMKKIIDMVKPAHLDYDFEFKYITWGDTKVYGKPASWYKSKGLTFKDVREGRHLTNGKL